MSLKPWAQPETGLQWSSTAETFDDAKALVRQHPEAAGNCARRIMDTELALVAERLRVPLPYLRGDRNDQRTCTDLLGRIISEAAGGRRLRKRQPDDKAWVVFPEPVEDWRSAHELLLAWANRSSHTGSLTATEATQLIDTCHKTIARFRCQDCGDYLWASEQSSRGRLQCTCGTLQWRFG